MELWYQTNAQLGIHFLELNYGRIFKWQLIVFEGSTYIIVRINVGCWLQTVYFYVCTGRIHDYWNESFKFKVWTINLHEEYFLETFLKTKLTLFWKLSEFVLNIITAVICTASSW